MKKNNLTNIIAISLLVGVLIVNIKITNKSIFKDFEIIHLKNALLTKLKIESYGLNTNILSMLGNDFLIQVYDEELEKRINIDIHEDYVEYNVFTDKFDYDNLLMLDEVEYNTYSNIYGEGYIYKSEKKLNEIKMIFYLNPYIEKAYNVIGDKTSVGYISLENFISRYPFEKFANSNSLEGYVDEEFIRKNKIKYYEEKIMEKGIVYSNYNIASVTQKNNVKYKIASFIEYNKKMIGLISMDLKPEIFGKNLAESYKSFIVMEDKYIFASNNYNDIDVEKTIFEQLKKYTYITKEEFKLIEENKVYSINKNHILKSNIPNTDMYIYTLLSTNDYMYQILVKNMPVSILFILLGFMAKAIKVIKVSEKKLLLSNSELIEKRKELENLSRIDPLTKLKNRRGVSIDYEKIIKQCKETKRVFCLLDIDYFKTVNDTYGHDIGDEVLISLSNMISCNKSNKDIISRWGGEEFLIIKIDRDIDSIYKELEELRITIENNKLVLKEFEIKITITIGVGVYEKGDSFESLVKKADESLYFGKDNGRNQVVIYDNIKNNI